MKASDIVAGGEWLVLSFQLPAGKSSGRVGLWRRLRRLGALGLGGSTWALPADAENRESLEWLRRDIEALGGRALLFEGEAVDAATATELRRLGRGERVTEGRSTPSGLGPPLEPKRFRGRTWSTRPRPGVDRMASAWLIRRFIDPKARFEFVSKSAGKRSRSIPFDTFGAELGHQQGLCTFEVLSRRFAIDEPAVAALGELVHAIDLHERAADPAEAALVERLVEGLRASHSDDGELLEAGIALFAALAASTRERPVGSKKRSTKRRNGERR